MVVLSLGKQYFPQCAAVADSLHFEVEEHLRVILGEEIDRAALLCRANQLHTLRHRPVGDTFAEYVDAAFQAFDRIGRMFMEKVCQNDRVQVLFDELSEAAAVNDPLAESVLRILQPIGTVVADRCESAALKNEILRQTRSASRAHDADFQCSHDRFLSLIPLDLLS